MSPVLAPSWSTTEGTGECQYLSGAKNSLDTLDEFETDAARFPDLHSTHRRLADGDLAGRRRVSPRTKVVMRTECRPADGS